MGFLKRLFGGGQPKKYVDEKGIYFHAKCNRCGTITRVRADKQHDLNRIDSGLVWNKTIVDNKCFTRMQATVVLNNSYSVVSQELDKGEFVTEDDWQAFVEAKKKPAVVEEDKEA